MIESNQKVKAAGPNKPTLRKRTGDNKGGTTTAGGSDPNSTGTSAPPPADSGSDGDRPTLKRRTDDNQ